MTRMIPARSGAFGAVLGVLASFVAPGCDAPQRTGGDDPAPPAAATATATRVDSAPVMQSSLARPTLHRVRSNDGSYLVIYRTRPEPIPVGDRFTIEATVHDARRGEMLLRDVELHVDAAMPHHRHGMNVVPTVRRQNDGSFVASGMLFHMPGRWEIYFDVARGLSIERAQCEVWVE